MASIIDQNGEYLSQGLQGQAKCDEALLAARDWAARRGELVFLYDEDDGSTEYDHYAVVEPDGTYRSLSDTEAANLDVEVSA
jgi:hypothetical protein